MSNVDLCPPYDASRLSHQLNFNIIAAKTNIPMQSYLQNHANYNIDHVAFKVFICNKFRINYINFFINGLPLEVRKAIDCIRMAVDLDPINMIKSPMR
jgi:hypothetical protein